MATYGSSAAPRWMKIVLRCAGLYNLLWGLWAMTMPESSFRLSGYEVPSNYPAIWQCLGMVLGLYGLGYWIAASDPFRHWPIIFIGWLGKVFGPIGMAVSIYQGGMPASAARLVFFNDLIWWIPFTLILWEAARHESNQTTGTDPVPPLDDALQQFRSQRGETLWELSQQRPLLVVFLRHSGCTFCREALADIAAQRASIEQANTGIALVHMSSEEDAAQLFAQYGLGDVPRFSDPAQVLFRAFDLRLGRFKDLFGLKVMQRGFDAAIRKRHGFGGLQGNGLRLPGVFLLERGKVVRAYRHETAADRPDYTELACPLPQ